MSDSGRGVGLTSAASRRVTRSASREAAAPRTPARATQHRPAAPPSQSRPTKQQSPPTLDEQDEEEERKAEAEAGGDTAAPCSADYERVKADLLNEPALSKAKRVYEYINREHYRDIERSKEAYEAAVARQEADEKEAQQPKLYSLLFSDPTNRSTLYTLLLASAAMLLGPLLTFYGVSSLLYGLGWQDKWRLSVSGACAVVAVNVVSIGFGLYAYWEKEDDETEEERELREGRTRANQDEWVRQATRGQMVAVGKWNEEMKQEIEEAQQGRKKLR